MKADAQNTATTSAAMPKMKQEWGCKSLMRKSSPCWRKTAKWFQLADKQMECQTTQDNPFANCAAKRLMSLR